MEIRNLWKRLACRSCKTEQRWVVLSQRQTLALQLCSGEGREIPAALRKCMHRAKAHALKGSLLCPVVFRCFNALVNKS